MSIKVFKTERWVSARGESLATDRIIESDVPGRLDRLPWSRWHLRTLIALGTSWLLDGLEVTLVGSLAGILTTRQGLQLTDEQVTASASIYLAGAVCGALLFGYLTDRLGRRRLFLVTVATYSLATLASAFSWSFFSFAICRSTTGVGKSTCVPHVPRHLGGARCLHAVGW